jgi:hypothetical protein
LSLFSLFGGKLAAAPFGTFATLSKREADAIAVKADLRQTQKPLSQSEKGSLYEIEGRLDLARWEKRLETVLN